MILEAESKQKKKYQSAKLYICGTQKESHSVTFDMQ